MDTPTSTFDRVVPEELKNKMNNFPNFPMDYCKGVVTTTGKHGIQRPFGLKTMFKSVFTVGMAQQAVSVVSILYELYRTKSGSANDGSPKETVPKDSQTPSQNPVTGSLKGFLLSTAISLITGYLIDVFFFESKWIAEYSSAMTEKLFPNPNNLSMLSKFLKTFLNLFLQESIFRLFPLNRVGLRRVGISILVLALIWMVVSASTSAIAGLTAFKELVLQKSGLIQTVLEWLVLAGMTLFPVIKVLTTKQISGPKQFICYGIKGEDDTLVTFLFQDFTVSISKDPNRVKNDPLVRYLCNEIDDNTKVIVVSKEFKGVEPSPIKDAFGTVGKNVLKLATYYLLIYGFNEIYDFVQEQYNVQQGLMRASELVPGSTPNATATVITGGSSRFQQNATLPINSTVTVSNVTEPLQASNSSNSSYFGKYSSQMRQMRSNSTDSETANAKNRCSIQ